jgi:hypothetical protein
MTQKQTATIDHPPSKNLQPPQRRNATPLRTRSNCGAVADVADVADVAAVSGRGQKKFAVVENLPQSVARKIAFASGCSKTYSRSR